MPNRIVILDETANLTVALTLDVIDSETHSGKATITKHPVEKGVDVASHVRPDPRPFTWSGALSELPMNGQPRDKDRLKVALMVLEDLRLSTSLFTVATSHAIYSSMHLSSYTATHGKGMPGALDVTVAFEELHVVDAQRVNVKLPKVPKKGPDATKGSSSDGKQVPVAASADAKRKSLMARGWDGDFNIFGSDDEEG